jgi:transmembrane sensor
MTQSNEIDRYRNEAFAWVVRLFPGNATTADVEEFKRWSSRSQAHAQAFVEARRVWEASRLPARNVFDKDRAGAAVSRHADWTRSRIARRAFLGGALAASAAAAAYLAVDPPLGLWPSFPDLLAADYRTARGEQRRVTLAGASIEMNTETSIALRPETEYADRVELIAGEGAFTTGSRDIEVVAAQGRAWASRASFNMRRDGSVVHVTCTDGEVHIACGSATASIGVGQQVSYSRQGLNGVTVVDPSVVAAWQNGFLIFHDMPLNEVIAEANRYRRGRIILMNEELGRRLVNARLRLDRIEDVVTKVAAAFGAKTTSLPGGVVILS